MSNSKYLKASDLGIRDKVKRGLIWTKKMLRSKAIKSFTTVEGPVPEHQFSMEWWFVHRDQMDSQFQKTGQSCGTVGCIGGHVAAYLDGARTADDLNKAPTETYFGLSTFMAKRYVRTQRLALERLFYPNYTSGWKASPAAAADEIDKYLRTGEVPSW